MTNRVYFMQRIGIYSRSRNCLIELGSQKVGIVSDATLIAWPKMTLSQQIYPVSSRFFNNTICTGRTSVLDAYRCTCKSQTLTMSRPRAHSISFVIQARANRTATMVIFLCDFRFRWVCAVCTCAQAIPFWAYFAHVSNTKPKYTCVEHTNGAYVAGLRSVSRRQAFFLCPSSLLSLPLCGWISIVMCVRVHARAHSAPMVFKICTGNLLFVPN